MVGDSDCHLNIRSFAVGMSRCGRQFHELFVTYSTTLHFTVSTGRLLKMIHIIWFAYCENNYEIYIIDPFNRMVEVQFSLHVYASSLKTKIRIGQLAERYTCFLPIRTSL